MKNFIKTLLIFAFIMPVTFLFAGCAKTYQIEYYVNGSWYKTVNVKSDESVFREPGPKQNGYIFDGWYLSETGDEKFDFSKYLDRNVKLYARYNMASYAVIYHNMDGATNNPNNKTSFDITTPTFILHTEGVTKTGYTFDGWYSDPLYVIDKTHINQGTHEDVHLYAKWNPNQYTITFVSNGGSEVASITAGYQTGINKPDNPTKEGYAFVGWYTDNNTFEHEYDFTTMPLGGATLYAKWNVNQYTITYELDGGTNNANNPATYTYDSATITLQDPTKTGYTFDGWYVGADQVTQIAHNSHGEITLTAHWTATPYTINYHLDSEAGEQNNANNPATYDIETAVSTLAAPTKVVDSVVYTFLGWFTDEDCTEAFAGIAVGSTGAKDVYAKWALMVDNEADFVNAIAISGETVIVTDDISLTNHINFANDITINLGEHTLTFAGDNTYLFKVPSNKSVTILNGSIDYTSSVIVNALSSYIENRGNLTLKEVAITLDNIVGGGSENLNAIGNNGEGVLVIEDSTITMQAEDNVSSAYKVVGLWNMGRTMLFKNSTLNVTTASRNSSYGVYNYINTGEVNPGTRTVTIDSSTINFTATSLISATGIFAESYVEGETNASNIVIIGTTYVNVTRDLESGSGKKTYALRAKGNATITGASNAQLNITDNTDCTQVERGEETGETGTGSITD